MTLAESKGQDGEGDDETSYWRYNDAMNALLTVCAIAVLLLSSVVLCKVDFAKVAKLYTPTL